MKMNNLAPSDGGREGRFYQCRERITVLRKDLQLPFQLRRIKSLFAQFRYAKRVRRKCHPASDVSSLGVGSLVVAAVTPQRCEGGCKENPDYAGQYPRITTFH